MELRQIKDLMQAMGRTGLKKLLIKNESFELQLERESEGAAVQKRYIEQGEASSTVQEKERKALSHGAGSLHPSAQEEAEVSGQAITSPMVGTFYASPSPDSPHFVKVGDTVDENTVVCIVEAMKVMNEVKAGVSGVVKEILVESGHPVEFGTKLFLVG